MRFKILIASALFACCLLPGFIFAHNQTVVIPLIEGCNGNDCKPLKNVVRVSSENGDYTTIEAAVNSIKDSSTTNHYLIVVGPGTYTPTQPLFMKDGIHLVGSGMNETTIIKGDFSGANKDSSSATITLKSKCTLSNVYIDNRGADSGKYAIGVLVDGSDVRLDNTHIYVSEATNGLAVYQKLNSATTIVDSILNSHNSLTTDTGLDMDDSSAHLNNVDVSVITTVGTATGVTDGFGRVHIRNSTISAGPTGTSLIINGTTSTIVQTLIENGIVTDNASGAQNCLDTYNDALTFISC